MGLTLLHVIPEGGAGIAGTDDACSLQDVRCHVNPRLRSLTLLFSVFPLPLNPLEPHIVTQLINLLCSLCEFVI